MFLTSLKKEAKGADWLTRRSAQRSFELGNEALGASLFDVASRQYILSFGDAHYESVDLDNMGVIYQGLLQFESARSCLDRSLRLHRNIGDRPGEAIVQSNIASLLWAQSSTRGGLEERTRLLNEALTTVNEALSTSREARDLAAEAAEFGILGRIQSGLASIDMAKRDQLLRDSVASFESGIELDRQVGDQLELAKDLLTLTSIYIQRGDKHRALDLLNEASAVIAASGIGDVKGIGNADLKQDIIDLRRRIIAPNG